LQHGSKAILSHLQKQGLRSALPLRKTESRTADDSDSKRGMKMARLYRSGTHPQHWFAYTLATGWVIFPAKVNGWDDRRKAAGLNPAYLREVPLWMAFGTGLSEDAGAADLRSAA
jgi:hypothetical protein